MSNNLTISNKRPSQRAFKPQTILDGVHERLRVLFDKPEHKDIQQVIYTFAEWITVPYSSWSIPNDGAARHVARTLEAGEKLDGDILVLADLLSPIPSEAEQEAVAEHEFAARTGKYDSWVDDAVKVAAREKEVLDDPDYHRFLKWIMERFNIKKRATPNGIVRRTMGRERNHRGPDFKFDLSTEKKRFQLIWDCFCWRFQLYGLDLNTMKPLVMKMSVYVTAFSTDISLPRRQSCDFIRDIKISAVGKLHKSGGV